MIPNIWTVCRPYSIALLIFAGSRVVVYVAIVFAIEYVRRAGGDVWDAGPAWYHRLLRWDTGWYSTIVDAGYGFPATERNAQNAAFYPLYPWLARVVTWFGLGTYNSLLLVANLFSLPAILLFFKFARDEYGDDVGYLSVAFLSFFPTSFFLSAGYPESVTLTFMMACILLLRRGALIAAAAAAGIALLSRPTGIVLTPIVLLYVWRFHRADHGAVLRYGLICGLLATSGLTIYMLHLWIVAGDPMRFSTATYHWHQVGQGKRLLDALMLKPLMVRATEGSFFFSVPLAFLIVFWRRLEFSLALLALGVLMLPYLTVTASVSSYFSMPRYALLAFPLFILLARLTKDNAWLAASLCGVSAAGLFAYTARFAQWQWAG